jgi:hypothetical protein
MSDEIVSTNPVVRAIIAGTAPPNAVLAASRGILPLPQIDLLELLVHLAKNGEPQIAANAQTSIENRDKDSILTILDSSETAPSILGYFAESENTLPEFQQTALSNAKTPDTAIAKLARQTKNGELLELISLNQQRLIRVPTIIDAIIANPFRTAEAERRAAETRREFFEKERGAQQIAEELRARGKEAAAELFEQAETIDLAIEDAILLAEHIEVPDAEINDSWLSLEYIEEFYEETPEEREAIVNKILGDIKLEDNDVSAERVSMVSRILKMTMKDRVKLAQKGDREARTILIRDPNRIVSQAVINNPRITEQEIEKIAAMRVVPEDVLRQIAINRAWARNYSIMHNLARNPRTPLGNVVSILTRLQLRDLDAISKNRNVSEAVRKQALRLVSARKGR